MSKPSFFLPFLPFLPSLPSLPSLPPLPSLPVSPRALLLASLFALLGGCSDGGGPVLPGEKGSEVASVLITPETYSLLPDSTELFRVQAFDKEGAPLDRITTAAWSSSDTSVAFISSVGRVQGRSVGSAEIYAEIDGVKGKAVVSILAPPIAGVDLSVPAGATVVQDTLRMATADTLRLVSSIKDVNGKILTGTNPTYTSSNSSVLAVSADGLLSPKAAGTARITGSLGGKSDQVLVQVEWSAPHRLDLGSEEMHLGVGEDAQLVLSAFDARENRLPVNAATWSSSNSAVVSVSQVGMVKGITVGKSEVSASLHSKSAKVSIEVTPAASLTISQVSPSVLRPGSEVKIQGSGFGSISSAAKVLLGSIPMQVISLSEVEITAKVPGRSATDPCEAQKQMRLSVSRTIGGQERTSGSDVLYQSAPSLQLGLGESKRLSGKDAGCVEIPEAEGEYLVSLFHADTNASSNLPLSLEGISGGIDAANRILPSASRSLSVAPLPSIYAPEQGVEQISHARILESNRSLYQNLQRARSLPGASLSRSISPATSYTEGSIITLNYPRGLLVAGGKACEATPVTARVVRVGTHSVVLEDASGPWTGKMDTELRSMGQEFDSNMLPNLKEHFGDPLKMDKSLDNNGKLLMFFTHRIAEDNKDILGFVSLVDWLPRSQCAGSNLGEIFYARTPVGGETLSGWKNTMRSTTVHEVKHLISYAERTSIGAPSEEAWLEEGTAKMAEEIWGRDLLSRGPKENLGFAPWVSCDVTPTGSSCAGRPEGMISHFGFLYYYLRKMETYTPLGAPMQDEYSVYGSAWALTRWSADHFGGDEASFLRSLVSSSSSGMKNLSERTGRSSTELLSDFSLAIFVDDHPEIKPRSSALSFPSWNLREIYKMMLNKSEIPAQLREQDFGSFSIDATVRGGSAALIRLRGGVSGSQLLKLNAGGAELAATTGLHIIRTR